ncbi:MAG: radical SAM protein [Acidobacteria bacterium]|nr:radical SAM protein [Acidobacteriota bacterium]
MEIPHTYLQVEFRHAHEKKMILLADLVGGLIHFLEHFGEAPIVGKAFRQVIGAGSGIDRLARLLRAAGYENDIYGFCVAMVQQLERAGDGAGNTLTVNEVVLPYHFLLAALEVIIPGTRFFSIKSVRQLERLTNVTVPDEEREDMRKVLSLYPVRLSLHTMRQMRLSDAVAYQYMPFVDELNPEGLTHTWVGQFHRGIVEQMYRNRVIFILNMACPVYCRFCFRKHKECRNQKAPTQAHVKDAVLYIKNSPEVKEIVLTGGDPFMNRATLTAAVDGLKEVPHVQTLRIATRCIAYYPHMFFDRDSFWLNYLKQKSLELDARDKRIEVATHFIHPDEISLESLAIISELTANGIAVYVQTPLLKDCNNQGPELAELYRRLRSAGAEMHYIYMPCSPIKGNRRYCAPLADGFRVAAHLRAHLSDRAIPSLCTATAIGKIDWNTSGWAVERDEKDPRYLWIRTPYTSDYFSSFAPILQLSHVARENAEGTLDVTFMAAAGDDRLLLGTKEARPGFAAPPLPDESVEEPGERIRDRLAQLRVRVLEEPLRRQSIVPTGSGSLFREHKTRVEFDLDAPPEEMEHNIRYIQADERITDIIFASQHDILGALYPMSVVLERLRNTPHVTAYRLRSCKFNYFPQQFTAAVIQRLAALPQRSLSAPKRVEIETQFFHANEITAEHGRIARSLRQKGITVYNNTPLIPEVNDRESLVQQLAYRCRRRGMEMHQLYLAGLPIQAPWLSENPLDIHTIIDIATYLRRYESGREVPRYIIHTPLGDVDFGLTSWVLETDETGIVTVSLRPYDLDYFQSLDPDFRWPDGITFDEEGHPAIRVPNLKRSPDFLVNPVS